MGRIDPKTIEQMQISTGIEIKRDMYGNPIAYRGKYLLQNWYDNEGTGGGFPEKEENYGGQEEKGRSCG
jgi:hypothetical protein